MNTKRKYVLPGIIILVMLIVFLVYNIFQHQPLSKNSSDKIFVNDVSKVEPGYALSSLHKQGYTGKGINVAIIDSLIFEDHEEFKGRLVHYEKIGAVHEINHGTTVASVLVGKRCGVLPEANLYYFAVDFGNEDNMLKAIEKVMELNNNLAEEQKIRFVNISSGPREKKEEFYNLIEKAANNEIVIFSSTIPTRTDPPFALRTATIEKDGDINDINNIIIGDWVNEYLKKNNKTKEWLIQDRKIRDQENGYITAYIPSVGRYVASAEEKDQYKYDKEGGLSWATPVLTGLAAMTLQINSNLSNVEVLDLLSKAIITNDKGLDVIDPTLLVELAKKTSK